MNESCFVCEEPARSALLVQDVVGVRRVPMCVVCYDSVIPEGRGLRTKQDLIDARSTRMAIQDRGAARRSG